MNLRGLCNLRIASSSYLRPSAFICGSLSGFWCSRVPGFWQENLRYLRHLRLFVSY